MRLRRPGDRLRGWAVLAVVAGVVLAPGVAQAHAAFVESDPEPGARLSTPPGAVRLRFTEPLNQSLSKATVVAPDGAQFEGRPVGPYGIGVQLLTSSPGIYTVEWSTVSVVDGHTLHGSFQFGVNVPPGVLSKGGTEAGPRRADLLIAVARALEYLALLVAIGMIVVGHLGRRNPPLEWIRPRLRVAVTVAFVAGLTVVLGETASASGGISFGNLAAYLGGGLPGAARMFRLTMEGLAVSVTALPWLALPAALLVAAVGGVSAAGHAASTHPAWLGIGIDWLHLLTAGVWAGGILTLATLRPPGGWRSSDTQELLRRFSPLAIPAFLLTVAFGVVRGVQELGTPSELVSSSYGIVLLTKVLLVLGMVPLSVLAWGRLVAPRAEAVLVVAVVGAAALLAAYPLPPGRAGEAESAQKAARTDSALPRGGELTLGGHAGPVLVGLTVRPATPGSNEALVYLLPLEGSARDLPVALEVDGRRVAVQPCGDRCRRADVRLRGGEDVEVAVGGSVDRTAPFHIPALPAPEGGGLLASVQRRMHELRTYRLAEVLSSGLSRSVRADYAFQAPDRMRVVVGPPSSTRVVIGSRDYRRSGRHGSWKVLRGGPSIPVPAFIWDSFRPHMDPVVVGSERVDGVPTRILAFFGRAGSTPVWFRLWVDGEDLVHRAQMRADGHFMDHTYYDFDGAFSIEPPKGAAP